MSATMNIVPSLPTYSANTAPSTWRSSATVCHHAIARSCRRSWLAVLKHSVGKFIFVRHAMNSVSVITLAKIGIVRNVETAKPMNGSRCRVRSCYR